MSAKIQVQQSILAIFLRVKLEFKTSTSPNRIEVSFEFWIIKSLMSWCSITYEIEKEADVPFSPWSTLRSSRLAAKALWPRMPFPEAKAAIGHRSFLRGKKKRRHPSERKALFFFTFPSAIFGLVYFLKN